MTAADGTADVTLPPGNYTVESDQPVVFQGKAWHWTQTLDIVAGRDAALELTGANAEATESVTTAAAAAAPPASDGAGILARFQGSVVTLWTATTRASGFVVDASGLVVTSQRVVGTATSIEVQLTPALKVAGSVIAAEPGRDVAVIRIDPSALASTPPVPLGCGAPAPALTERQEMFALGAPLREPKGAYSGRLGRVGPHALETDLDLPGGAAGGPAFTADGTFAGLTSIVDGSDERRPDFRVVRTGDVCAAIASAGRAAANASPPSGAHLPVEPATRHSRGRARGGGEDARRQPEPVSRGILGLRRVVHHSGPDLCVATSGAADEPAGARQQNPGARSVRGSTSAGADGVRPLVASISRIRRRCCSSG